MTIVSSVIDASIALAGALGILIAFVAALRGIEAPMAGTRSRAAEPGAVVRRAA